MLKFSKILFLFAIGYTLLAGSVYAQELTLAPKCNPTLPPNPTSQQLEKARASGESTTPCDITAFIIWIRQIIQFLTIIAVPIGIGFIVYGGFVIMTAGGSEDRVHKGKGIITASAIGLAIVFGAWLIVTTVKQILGAF